jgi:hypothetical protein
MNVSFCRMDIALVITGEQSTTDPKTAKKTPGAKLAVLNLHPFRSENISNGWFAPIVIRR